MRRPGIIGVLGFLGLLLSTSLFGQQVEVEKFVLDNGMTFLLLPRKGDPNVAAGWLAKVGSANERPSITGLSHLFEHMMFKGTHVVGTSDIDRDLEIMTQLDRIKAELRREEQESIRRWRLGEISDAADPSNRSPRHQRLLEEFEQLLAEQKDLLVKNEFDRIYTQGGASSMNAFTNQDQTVYFINVPANKLELWFWMESDRLLNPVFREFYSERDVVHEERRLRTDSTPTGRFREQFESMFWVSHPYGWPVVGWPSDLEGITREEAQAYFSVNYAPNNLVACLVGDFDPEVARSLAADYFGRLKRSEVEPQPVRTQEVEQQAEMRMVAFAETNPEAEIRYHTVADGHVDEPALVVLGALLSGRTGRLYKSLVLEQQVANNASAGQRGLKWAGYFSLQGVAKPGRKPEEVEQALYAEVDKLREELVGERELQKVKNRFAAGNFRRMQSNFGMMIQLLLAESNRGWETFNQDPQKIQEVTPEDIRRVVERYFQPENRTVALYYTKQSESSVSAEAEDPLLAGLSDEDKAQVRQLRMTLGQLPLARLRRMLAMQEQQSTESIPEEKRQLFEVVKQMIRERIKALEEGKQ